MPWLRVSRIYPESRRGGGPLKLELESKKSHSCHNIKLPGHDNKTLVHTVFETFMKCDDLLPMQTIGLING